MMAQHPAAAAHVSETYKLIGTELSYYTGKVKKSIDLIFEMLRYPPQRPCAIHPYCAVSHACSCGLIIFESLHPSTAVCHSPVLLCVSRLQLRAYLRYKDIQFEEVLATHDIYKNFIVPKTGVAYIPVLLLPDNVTALQDTTTIIDHLEGLHHHHKCAQPDAPKQLLASMLIEVFADEFMTLPAMYYRYVTSAAQLVYVKCFDGAAGDLHTPSRQQVVLSGTTAVHVL